MHPGSPSDPSGTAATKAKPRQVYSILKPHGQSSKSPIRLLPCKAKLSYVYTTLNKHHLPRVGPKQMRALANLGYTRAADTSQYINTSLFEGTKTSISLYFHFTLMENIKSRGWCDSEPFICFHPTCWLGRQSNCFQLTAVLDFDSVVKLLEAT